MKYPQFICLSLLFSNIAFAADPPIATPIPTPKIEEGDKQPIAVVAKDTPVATVTEKSDKLKPVKTNTASIEKLKKLASISTQQTSNVGFDIKSANIVKEIAAKGVNVTKGTNFAQITNVKVTSFTRREENISNISAAMYVITSDEIKRMGVQNLGNILRFAPGVAVVQANADSWYIAVRGFNNASSTNKLLVLIDGRSIYSTLYGGVLWSEQDYFLEDIERIEIIRGPGGVVWGANAVNGVINIITKNSKDTQGLLVSAGGGNVNQLGEGRIGGQLAPNTYGRFYVKSSNMNRSSDIPVTDAGIMLQSGFRVDRLSNEIGDMRVSGDIYQGSWGQKLDGVHKLKMGEEYTGNNLGFNWSYNASKDQNHQILAYYDHVNLAAAGLLIDNRNTFDLEYQFSQKLQIQQIIAGLSYRRVSDTIPAYKPVFFTPLSKIDNTYAGFIQDDISLLCEQAHLIVGTKYEHNAYTGSEWQPSIRGTYSFGRDSLMWAAVSRAVRIPTRLEEDANLLPMLRAYPHLSAEEALVYEAGWRKKWSKISFDVAAFTSFYKNLVTLEVGREGNKMSGRVAGFEISPSFQLQPGWLMRLNYSFAASNLTVSSSSVAVNTPFFTENSYPRNMAEIISMWDINDCWQFNAYLRYMDQLRVPNTPPPGNAQTIPAYVVADLSVIWKQNKILHWQLVGRNLGKKHYEWGGRNSPPIGSSVSLYLDVNLL